MESLIPPFDAYKGESPYIFVSYAHKNSEVVFSHITRLHNEGFRIWYDEGIDPGADWSDEIASALAGAAVFLVFISDAAVASHNVRKEIVFAIDQRKYMLCVHIEETELPYGLKMQLGNIQALLEPRFHDKEKFYNKLFSSLLPDQTLGAERDTLPVRDIPRKAKATTTPAQKNSTKKRIWAALLAVVLGLAAFSVFGLMGSASNTGPAFADKNLELALREEMQNPRGSIAETDLAAMKGRLSLAGRDITDISPLKYLNSISMINLDNNNITDISALGGLTELMVLGLANNRITDITPLRNLGGTLVGLSLAGNTQLDLMGLSHLNKLEVLDISGISIINLEFAKHLRQLKSLILDANGNGLTPDKVSQLKDLLPPNCKISFNGNGAR